MNRKDIIKLKLSVFWNRITRPFRLLRQKFCGWFVGHVWKDEKEFVSCVKCKFSTAKRNLAMKLTGD